MRAPQKPETVVLCREFGGDLCSAIAGAVVDHDAFELVQGLTPDALEAGLKSIGGLEGRQENGYPWL